MGEMVRPGRQQDESRIYELLCCLEETILDPEEFGRIYREYLESPNIHCLVYEMEGIVAGMLTLRCFPMLCRAGRVGEIAELVVDPSVRSRGIGHQLFQKAEQLAQETGCLRLEAASNQRRKGAHRFYRREGMAETHLKFVKVLCPPDSVVDRF